MPVARGIMRMGRINIRPTTTIFEPNVISAFNHPSPAACSDAPFTVAIRVTTNTQAGLSDIRPSGNIIVLNTLTGATLGSGILVPVSSNSSTVTIPLAITGDNINLAAYYVRVNNDFIVSNATNATPIVITTASPHKLVSLQSVTISGALGNTAANGTFTITVPATTIGVASNNIALPTGTINVASTTGFPSSGTFSINTSAGVQTVTYGGGGGGGTTFTGCSGGTGTMSTGGTVRATTTLSLTGSVGNGAYIANSATILGPSFEASNTATTIYSVSFTPTETTITSPTPSVNPTVFCVASAQSITAHVETVEVPPVLVTSGVVNFRLYSDESNFINLANGNLNGSGNASTTIPAASLTPGSYSVQAIYPGGGCNSTSSTPGGILLSTTKFLSINNDVTTSVSPAPVGSSTFCRKLSKSFTVHVDGTLLADPSIGTITLYAAPNPAGTPETTLGSATPVSGNATIVVPADTFPSSGSFLVYYKYVGDGYCYANSDSGTIIITSTENATVTATDDMATFDHTAPQTFHMHLSSSTAGTITGTASLTHGAGVTGATIGPVPVSGPHTGFDVDFSVPANHYTAGTATFTFTFTSDTGCYNTATSVAASIIVT